MSNCYVLTTGGFKPIDQIIDNDNSCPICFDLNLLGTSGVVDHWETIGDESTYYRLDNAATGFKMWFSDKHKLYVINEQTVHTVAGDDLYENYKAYRLSVVNRFQLTRNESRAKRDRRSIEQAAIKQRISTDYIDGPLSETVQLLFDWEHAYGSYYARDYNKMMLLQSIVAGSGYNSRVVRDNGFKVIRYESTTISIDQITSGVHFKLQYIPYDKNNNQLHLMYNVDNYTFIV